MPFWRLYYHLVWATKNREPLIVPQIEPRLYAYLVHKAAEQGVYVYAVNGWQDQVHTWVSGPVVSQAFGKKWLFMKHAALRHSNATDDTRSEYQ